MTALIVTVMVVIDVAIAASGIWLALNSQLRGALAARVERRLHRASRSATAFTPWGRTSPAFRFYGVGMFFLGLAVASGLLVDGPEALIGLVGLGVTWPASLTAGWNAAVRARMGFVGAASRV
jgi:hypothetical protein